VKQRNLRAGREFYATLNRRMWEARAGRARRRPEPPRSPARYLLLLAVAALAGFASAIAAGSLALGDSRAGPPSGGGAPVATSTVTTPASTTTPTGTTTPATTGTTTTTTPYTVPTTTVPTTTTPVSIKPHPPIHNPLLKRGMWIWVLSASQGGNLGAIIARAKHHGIRTLFVKSGDGTSVWTQFNPSLVEAIHAARIDVCAWQYVYGDRPVREAEVGAQAAADGADCLVIDAEAEYQGKYVQAQRYLTKLRQLIGPRYPIALAGFPYISYHPAFPYSVFLGPSGAQYNTPQMYWKDIGTTVDRVYAHTYEYNELFRRPIEPLGQVFDSPPAKQIRRFRSVSRVYGAKGVSWWDWQSATNKAFNGVSQPAGPIPGFTASAVGATLRKGASGDVVVWAQEHLVTAGAQIAIDGAFGPQTRAAVETFQLARGLPVTGVIDSATWTALLRYSPASVEWVTHRKHPTAVVTRAGVHVEPVPRSASAPERRDELAGAGGARRPLRRHRPGRAARR
jgi:Putative peptidoglycan binding domain